MIYAIYTVYMPPRYRFAARVRATCYASSCFSPWHDDMSAEENHMEAARLLASKMLWDGRWIGGELAGGGYAFVNTRGGGFTVRIENETSPDTEAAEP